MANATDGAPPPLRSLYGAATPAVHVQPGADQLHTGGEPVVEEAPPGGAHEHWTEAGQHAPPPAQPPLPEWQQEMLDARPKSRASVHRSAYPEDAALRAAGYGLALPPVKTPVVVGMTTTPTRISHIRPAVESLRVPASEVLSESGTFLWVPVDAASLG